MLSQRAATCRKSAWGAHRAACSMSVGHTVLHAPDLASRTPRPGTTTPRGACLLACLGSQRGRPATPPGTTVCPVCSQRVVRCATLPGTSTQWSPGRCTHCSVACTSNPLHAFTHAHASWCVMRPRSSPILSPHAPTPANLFYAVQLLPRARTHAHARGRACRGATASSGPSPCACGRWRGAPRRPAPAAALLLASLPGLRGSITGPGAWPGPGPRLRPAPAAGGRRRSREQPHRQQRLDVAGRHAGGTAVHVQPARRHPGWGHARDRPCSWPARASTCHAHRPSTHACLHARRAHEQVCARTNTRTDTHARTHSLSLTHTVSPCPSLLPPPPAPDFLPILGTLGGCACACTCVRTTVRCLAGGGRQRALPVCRGSTPPCSRQAGRQA